MADWLILTACFIINFQPSASHCGSGADKEPFTVLREAMEAFVSFGKAGNGQSFEVSISYLKVKTIICRLKCICFGFP